MTQVTKDCSHPYIQNPLTSASDYISLCDLQPQRYGGLKMCINGIITPPCMKLQQVSWHICFPCCNHATSPQTMHSIHADVNAHMIILMHSLRQVSLAVAGLVLEIAYSSYACVDI